MGQEARTAAITLSASARTRRLRQFRRSAMPTILAWHGRWSSAALPEAGWLHDDGRWVIPTGRGSITVVRVESGDGYFEPVEEGYKAFATIEPGWIARGDLAPSPAEALRALADRIVAALVATPPETPLL